MPDRAGDPPPHSIRLRGPWDFEWLEPPAHLRPGDRSGRLTFPASWPDAFGPAAGTVRLSRRFGRPAEPDPEDRVWLEIILPDGEVSAVLNGDWMATFKAGTVRLDVTGRLEPRNRLDLDLRIEKPTRSSEPALEVALVFEPSAFADDL